MEEKKITLIQHCKKHQHEIFVRNINTNFKFNVKLSDITGNELLNFLEKWETEDIIPKLDKIHTLFENSTEK